LLPALLLRGIPTTEPTYTRRPGWTQPLESLWCILAKWQLINCLPYSTLARCVSPLSRAQTCQGVDLRVLDGFDLDALTHHSGVPRAALAAGACSAAADSPVLALASINLRFCPSCMRTGFHATLFQFMPIARCPIHDDRLLEACPGCGGQIPYRLDSAFAANPLACPHCLRSLLADLTVLMRTHLRFPGCDNILRWQRLLAKYAYWYAIGPRSRIEPGDPAVGGAVGLGRAKRNAAATNSLAFIGTLQDVLREPPLMPSIASRRTAIGPHPHRRVVAAFDLSWQPSFTNACWPSFQTQIFVDLCHRYARFHHDHQRHDSMRNRRITHWWRRTWDGAISRPIPPSGSFEEPPFGVAEWVAFSPPLDSALSAGTASLVSRFDEDLQLTWDGWSGVLDQIDCPLHAGLHPRLVPPRSCWLAEPPIHPDAPALGFF
jgi:hypothetical protein